MKIMFGWEATEIPVNAKPQKSRNILDRLFMGSFVLNEQDALVPRLYDDSTSLHDEIRDCDLSFHHVGVAII